MQLQYIKLSGFKSFVDPTLILFPSNLVAVVGPNGCGKSNVIDAVRWVMGESSAKNLRGESMVDVIFNGSSERRSVGQATVELVFDNSLGRIGGAYASYQEISVKRIVTRSGESTYFLNDTRCRRRDITDLFLGTGAGARGYSIIGQGTISKIVEARPEELRTFIEEAAGVSHYKERKRETVARINNTRENLVRVEDIRTELQSHLQKLELQAQVARSYKELQQKIRTYKVELLGLKVTRIDQVLGLKQANARRLLLENEQLLANLTSLNARIELENQQLIDKTALINSAQSRIFQLRVDIVRLQEQYQHRVERQKKIREEKAQCVSQMQLLNAQYSADEHELEQQGLDLEDKRRMLLLNGEKLRDKKTVYNEAANALDVWQKKWNTVDACKTQHAHALDVTLLKRSNLRQRQQEIFCRLEKIEQESATLIADSPVLDSSVGQRAAMVAQKTKISVTLEELHAHRQKLKMSLSECEEDFFALQKLAQKLDSEQANQQAIIAANKIVLRNNPRDTSVDTVLTMLDVDAVWQPACQWLLGRNLHAQVVDNLDTMDAAFIKKNASTHATTIASSTKAAAQAYPTLSSKMRGITPAFLPHFNSIYTAENIEQAFQWLPYLQANESIITPDKYWLGVGWLQREVDACDEPINIIALQQKIVALDKKRALVGEKLAQLHTERQQKHEDLNSTDQEIAVVESDSARLGERIREAETKTLQFQHAQQQINHSAQRLMEEKNTSTQQLEALVYQDEILALEADETRTILAKAASDLERMEHQKHQGLQELNAVRLEVQQLEGHAQKQILACEKLKLAYEQQQRKIASCLKEQAVVAQRQSKLAQELAEVDGPQEKDQTILEQKYSEQSVLEQDILDIKQVVESSSSQLATLKSEVQKVAILEKNVQNAKQKTEIEVRTLSVQRENFISALEELGVLFSSVKIPSGEKNIETVERNLLIATAKSNEFGAINLAAIDEYDTELARKNYLDQQYDDLTCALSTLEDAIKKIDSETICRFQHAFEEINRRFSELFPRMFGGGSARLELSCDNLLEAGILVMAQPLGKRNSRIQLLSGGEKAMTAIALVFAIFQLNPSPFCMLDEVDAPLDEANVGRFCTLVKEMSQFVQFLFITHNKVTMELADHLVGVTMREPGVSRIVAVDVEQALAFAEA